MVSTPILPQRQLDIDAMRLAERWMGKLRDAGVVIETEDLSGQGLNGSAHFTTWSQDGQIVRVEARKIVLGVRLGHQELLHTLLHEVAHYFMHRTPEARSFSKNQSEYEAELMAGLLMTHYFPESTFKTKSLITKRRVKLTPEQIERSNRRVDRYIRSVRYFLD